MSEEIGKLFCWIGLHEWRWFQESFLGEVSGLSTTVVWKQCEHCPKSKLVHILR